MPIQPQIEQHRSDALDESKVVFNDLTAGNHLGRCCQFDSRLMRREILRDLRKESAMFLRHIFVHKHHGAIPAVFMKPVKRVREHRIFRIENVVSENNRIFEWNAQFLLDDFDHAASLSSQTLTSRASVSSESGVAANSSEEVHATSSLGR